MISKVLTVSYNIWKSLVQNNSWVVYHLIDGSVTRKVWTGDRDHVYSSFVDEDNFSDWSTNFSSTSVQVALADDAYAQIVGLSGIRPTPISADGAPTWSKHQLELGREPFRRTDDGSEQMNINGIESGTPVIVWNGTGAGDSGGDWTRSGVGTETAESKHYGTYGLDTGVTVDGDASVFDNGSMTDVAGTYTSLVFWAQPKVFPPGSRPRVSWRDSSNNIVGSALRIDSYVSNMDINEWKQVQIPIEDFNLTGNVQKLVIRYQNSNGQRYWFDDFALVAAAGGGPYNFRVSAPTGYIYHVERVAIVVSAADSGWSSTSFASIAGGLGRGLLIRFKRIGADIDPHWKINMQDNAEVFGQLQVINDVSFSNGNRQFVFALEPHLSSVVLIDDDDVIDIVVRDDLSNLQNMRAFLHFGVELIP